jgi:hypothetical protein
MSKRVYVFICPASFRRWDLGLLSGRHRLHPVAINQRQQESMHAIQYLLKSTKTGGNTPRREQKARKYYSKNESKRGIPPIYSNTLGAQFSSPESFWPTFSPLLLRGSATNLSLGVTRPLAHLPFSSCFCLSALLLFVWIDRGGGSSTRG